MPNSTAQTRKTPQAEQLPVIVIGAGPVGLAAAAQLHERGLDCMVFEACSSAGAAIAQWGHTRLFSPWEYNIDAAARRLLESTGWTAPDPQQLPTGHELITHYLTPLAAVLGETIQLGARVVAVSRAGIDKTRSAHRDTTPFLVRVAHSDGTFDDVLASHVIDASGTWSRPNPLGQAGLSAPGETSAIANGLITAPLPDVTGTDRHRFANRHVLVVGAGHSAANTLLDLAELAQQASETQISWAVRSDDVSSVYGGEANDELAARGALGTRLRQLVSAGKIEVHTSFVITGFDHDDGVLTVQATTPEGKTQLDVDVLVPATGFRPDLNMLSELRLDLDPAVEAPRELGPLIDPEFHSCGSVQPHGERLLAHPEPGFYIVGMKSYGRAPTFLMATGYEQARSIAAALAGDRKAADDVQLVLPETGVCTTNLNGTRDAAVRHIDVSPGQGCCTTAAAAPELLPKPVSTCC